VALRVLEQVREHALEHDAVAEERHVAVDVDLDAAARRRGGLLEQVAQPERLRRHGHPRGVGAGEVEELLDEAAQPDGLRPRGLLELVADPGRELGSRAQRLERAVHGGGRRAQLVRGDRDEVELHLVELAGRVMELRALDRDGDAVSYELEQVDVVRGELARHERAHVEHADDVAVGDERNAEQRLDPLLPQERVEHVRVVDVRQDDRPALRGDPAGESAAHGDANALLDLLLDADGGARDELVRRAVEQQDRARVHVEDQRDPLQQLREELLELEVRERDVRDRLEPLEPDPRGPLGRVQPSALDRDRDAVSGELEQVHVVVGELARDERSDVQHAHYVALRDQGHAEQRLDPLLAQDRVEHVGVVDVRQDDWAALRGDAAGEAAADRDPDALLDLLLDPDGGARHELVRVGVEQQDRARVHVEERGDPSEQLREQLLDLEMGEGRVGDRLQTDELL
jgi:hypothetical protein